MAGCPSAPGTTSEPLALNVVGVSPTFTVNEPGTGSLDRDQCRRLSASWLF